MQESALGLILDVLIVVLLSATIYFAAKLSVYLRTFREGRAEMDVLIRTLSESILRAQEAVTGMRETADDAGKDLQALIHQSVEFSEELQLVNEAGNNLASRLEGLAERNREVAEQMEKKTANMFSYKKTPDSQSFTDSKTPVKAASSFMIRDPEFDSWDNEIEDDNEQEFFLSGMDEEWGEPQGHVSQAEKELHTALHKGKRKHHAVRKH